MAASLRATGAAAGEARSASLLIRRDYPARGLRLSNGRSLAFSLPRSVRRSKEAVCAVRVVAVRLPKRWLSVLRVARGSSRAVRAADLRILLRPSSVANVARPSKQKENLPQPRAANRKAQRLPARHLALSDDPYQQGRRELPRKLSGAS